MYQIWLYPVEAVIENLDYETRELIISQLEKWSQIVVFDRRTQPRGYSIAPVETPQYRGILCLVDHIHQTIIVLEFLPKVE
ncbi:hypothetical protein [Kamptonema sp. UHCC 0994]|uniref:hypothetical protein n=1 Tax=Kamptonema sp. UHCC 0994 TaxID=3031329 RepID=UPI0023B9A50E|nr:hypothetical protein [Kamptonema sp. UHCC 0994]MDF0553405.1 hypothetical protein [Kamptonema sp. UHCC 0994]